MRQVYYIILKKDEETLMISRQYQRVTGNINHFVLRIAERHDKEECPALREAVQRMQNHYSLCVCV